MNVTVIPMLEIMMERLLFTMPACKHTLYFIINPRRTCTARVTVVGSVCLSACVSVSVSVIQNLTNRPTNDTTYLMGNEGQIICTVFSENAPLQS